MDAQTDRQHKAGSS